MKSSLSPFLMLSTSLFCIAPLAADTNSDEMSMEKKTQIECQKANHPHRLEFKHIEAKGIGYNQGYTSFDAFFTALLNNYVPFIDLRAHLFNNGKWAANAGIGTRYIFDPCQWMVGANLFYDYRRSNHGAHLSQVGAGIEAFFDRFDFRLNGYLPFGDKNKRLSSELTGISFKGFSGNYILTNEYYNNKYEGAMKGFNGEVGVHLWGDRKEYDLFFGAGPYYYNISDGKHTWGGKVRLKVGATQYFFFEISDSYDQIFHNRFQGTINVSLPFGHRYCYPKKNQSTCSNVMQWQAVMPVERQEIIVVSKFKKKQTIDPVAIDPTTGNPFYVVFVDNTNPNIGNGTFESPFQNLSNNDNATSAQSGSFADNTIYVFAGDNTAIHMSGGNMVLKDKQRLLGSAHAHSYQTTKGLLTVPAQTAGMPHVQGVTGSNSAIILASDNEVSGLNISFNSNVPVSTGQACIQGNSAIVNANINHNILTNETYGLRIGGVTHVASASGIIDVNHNASSLHSVFSGISLSYEINVNNATVTFENNSTSNDTSPIGALFITCYNNSTVAVNNNTMASEGNFAHTTGYSFFQDMGATQPSTFIARGNSVIDVARGFTINNGSAAGLVVIHENNTFRNTTDTSFISSAAGTCCVRFNNNIGYPTTASPAFSILQTGGTLNLEPLINNYPDPTTMGTTSVPACTCAPCP